MMTFVTLFLTFGQKNKTTFLGSMTIIYSISELRSYISSSKKAGKSIGFVPTMGALHEGHIDLVKKAKAENDLAVVSIFVNPTQFNNAEDLKKYPRTLEDDCKMLEKAHCDLVFAPTPEEMYPELPRMKFDFGTLETVMEGKFRPGHFNGVGIVVAKLFHLTQPTRAYFGRKDIQQVAVIKRMVADLSFDVQLIACPTIRENDGLAMSSRNRRLSAEGRQKAPKVYESLLLAKSFLENGNSSKETQQKITAFFNEFPEFTLEYFEIADFSTLESIEKHSKEGETAICIAIFLDGVRLIDNIVI
jgi:pantoate--beta-alanine ligase